MLKTQKSTTTATYLPRVTHSKPAPCGGVVNVAVFFKTLSARTRARGEKLSARCEYFSSRCEKNGLVF